MSSPSPTKSETTTAASAPVHVGDDKYTFEERLDRAKTRLAEAEAASKDAWQELNIVQQRLSFLGGPGYKAQVPAHADKATREQVDEYSGQLYDKMLVVSKAAADVGRVVSATKSEVAHAIQALAAVRS